MDALYFKTAGIHYALAAAAGNGEVGVADMSSISAAVAGAQQRNSRWGLIRSQHPHRALWLQGSGKNPEEWAIGGNDAVSVEEEEGIGGGGGDSDEKGRNGKGKENWVLKILHVNSLWKEDAESDNGELVTLDGDSEEEEEEDSEVCVIEDERIGEFNNRETFTKLLRKVPLEAARLYGRMSYLGKLAYSIPRIKAGNLHRYHGLRLVTSSIEKKKKAFSNENQKTSGSNEEATTQGETEKPTNANANTTASASYAHRIAASAASYLHSHTPTILHFGSSSNAMATTDSVTAVVAANEQVRQAMADDLNSATSSPCEWFVCDDDQTATRFFIIQGSESLASWQANLLFEPIQFEGMDDVLVHRGIYEAAKGIYEQMLPEIHAHLKSHGSRAAFYFTGHSLGGSLSLLVNLMLLLREQVPRSSLLPVIIFGAPTIMCGGDHLLRKLGLPKNHVQSITMHRDIVPRAFSCHYPNHMAEFLKAINGNFRSLPCLDKQRLLYTPMGEFLILQPDDESSPSHHLLPPGSGLYLLTCVESDVTKADKQIQAAQAAFLNSPHPLEMLSDRSAYGSGGTIIRDHDMNSYLKSIRHIIRQELNHMRKTNRKHRRQAWWEVVAPPEINGTGGIIFSKPMETDSVMCRGVLNSYSVVKSGTDSLKRFHILIASQLMHLLVVFLLPARSMILGIWSLINYQHYTKKENNRK